MIDDIASQDGRQSDFPAALPEEDRERWAGMTVLQRKRARDRLVAIEAWRAGRMPLDAALVAADLSRTRFYSVAAEFRAAGTLASLGAFAGGAGKTRERLDPIAVNRLQAVVADVVALNRGASVSRLVQLMVEASGASEKDLPGLSRLRGIVEAEQRRADASGQAGHALKLDLTAINLPREDGRPHIMFTLLDEGTRLVLGAWTSGSTDEVDGYRMAAQDARARIVGPLAAVRWSDRLMRIEITVRDRVRGTELRARLIDAGVHAGVNVAPARYGGYFKRLVGRRVGRIEITPKRTEEGMAVCDNGDTRPWTDEEASAAVAVAVGHHNAGILAELDVSSGRPVVPDGLERALDVLTA